VSAAAKLLERLDRVKQTAPGKWVARCPAHEDGSPSLSIRESDGKLLVYCFASCSVANVMQAVGLSLSDLFESPLGHYFKPSKSRIPARDLLEIMSEETSIVAIIAADLLEKRAISDADWQRLAQAAARIGRARDHAHG
jgi:DNA primase